MKECLCWWFVFFRMSSYSTAAGLKSLGSVISLYVLYDKKWLKEIGITVKKAKLLKKSKRLIVSSKQLLT